MTDPIITAARFLTANLEWLRHQTTAAEALEDIDECARVIRSIARGPHEQRFLGPCGAYLLAEVVPGDPILGIAPDHETVICEGDVYGPRGGSVGRCRVCGAEVATADREAWLDAQTRSEAFSARDIADAYRIPVKTIRNWANRGQLRTYWRTDAGLAAEWPPPDDDQQHERLHYAGDVLDLATAAAVERAERQAAQARRREDAA